MSYHQPTSEDKDPRLWQIAQRRASFKSHLLVYITVNLFFWIIWYIKGNNSYEGGLPWPIWPMLGWTIGVIFHYVHAYVDRDDLITREYEKLKQNQSNNKTI